MDTNFMRLAKAAGFVIFISMSTAGMLALLIGGVYLGQQDQVVLGVALVGIFCAILFIALLAVFSHEDKTE